MHIYLFKRIYNLLKIFIFGDKKKENLKFLLKLFKTIFFLKILNMSSQIKCKVMSLYKNVSYANLSINNET